MDIITNLSTTPAGHKYVIAAVCCCTKWVEAKPLTQIDLHKVSHFIHKEIIYRYGMPGAIHTNQGKELLGEAELYLRRLRVEHHFIAIQTPPHKWLNQVIQ